MKPDIVFFNEPLPNTFHNEIDFDLENCDLCIIMGTSLQVAPVSSIPKDMKSSTPQILINREIAGFPNEFDSYLLGNCDDICNTIANNLSWQIESPIKANDGDNENIKEIKEMKEMKEEQVSDSDIDIESNNKNKNKNKSKNKNDNSNSKVDKGKVVASSHIINAVGTKKTDRVF